VKRLSVWSLWGWIINTMDFTIWAIDNQHDESLHNLCIHRYGNEH
jgi:hypothetical protein